MRAVMGWMVFLGLCPSCAFSAEAPVAKFNLPTSDGGRVLIPSSKPARFRVLCFLGAECPLAGLYGSRLQKLAEDFQNQGVEFLGINSNRQDSMDDVKTYVKQHALKFPIVKDYDNKVADYFQAQRTPEVIVQDAQGKIRYRGGIDNQYTPGIARTEATEHYLETALKELIAGQPVTLTKTEPAGCLIGKLPKTKTPTKLTYAREVSRILQKHCVECHRPGEIGPFSLTEYEEVLGWGEMILEVIEDNRMPPWHANPEHGQFANARHMPKSDQQTLREWVAGGMPFGDAKNLPKPFECIPDWQLPRKPDQILSMSNRPFTVKAQGVVDYQYFVIDPQFQEDKWITAAQVIPGNSRVVHHCIVFIRPPDTAKFRGGGFLTGYVPGQRAVLLPPGRARKVPAGSRLVFQMHYTPTGTEQTDLTKVGILFAQESEVTHEVFTLTALNKDFEIPPGHANFAVAGGLSRLPKTGAILAITPHMHYRGKSFRVLADRDDQTEVLLDVPRYDFNWQHIYELSKPLPLSSMDRLRFEARFDNSPNNPTNPDPARHVTWGDQTWEEMAIAFFEISMPRETPINRPTKRNTPAKSITDQDRKATEYVEKFFNRFDKNLDGEILKSELPLSQQRFGFRQFDRDGNGRIEREELQAYAKSRF